MASVTVESFKEKTDETASEKIIRKSNETFSVIDDLGRELKVRAPNYREKGEFIWALGERGTLETYFAHYAPVMCVRSIDGEPVTQFARLSDILATAQTLGDEGIAAIFKCAVENSLIKNPVAGEEKEKLKK